jgi:two-component system, sensor histidine kinase
MKATDGSRRALAPKLVIVIDDNPLVLDATGALLRAWGFEVVAAESQSDAMSQLAHRKRRPDLIVCDYRLSEGATGVDVIKGLRNAYEIPALLISGDESSPQPCGVTGAYSLLYKPIDAETLRRAVDRLFHIAGASVKSPAPARPADDQLLTR